MGMGMVVFLTLATPAIYFLFSILAWRRRKLPSKSPSADARPNWRFHCFMLAVTMLLVGISAGFEAAPILAMACVLILPAALWHDKKQYERRDAALTLPWVVVMAGLIPAVAMRSEGLRFPFQDAALIKIDRILGFNVPSIMSWCLRHPPSAPLLSYAYRSLHPLLLAAVVVPALVGRKRVAETVILANLFAFLAALPIFTFAPAVGPWAGYHFAGTGTQRATEAGMIALQATSVCVPSFHVIWAILSAWALRFIKPLRIPLGILAALIVISTVATGWHYGVDAIAGILFAGASLLCADAFLAWSERAAEHAVVAIEGIEPCCLKTRNDLGSLL
jgi:hypothetical protein